MAIGWKKFGWAAGLLTLAWAVPLGRLFGFALGDDLDSYIPLIPFVSGYLAWIQRSKIPPPGGAAVWPAAVFGAAGAAATGAYFFLPHTGAAGANGLAAGTAGWLLFLAAAGCWWLGGGAMRALAFPFFLLVFMVPLPVAVREGLETGLQHGSAAAADWLFTLAGTPVYRNALQFHLPGITLEVAPECSGIHSTWILLITSLVAGQVILRRTWTRIVLCLAVVPLALLRNGFRVFVLGQLCIHISPAMIDSPIHHHGGPIFFALSLLPLFLLLYFLRKGERTPAKEKLSKPGTTI